MVVFGSSRAELQNWQRAVTGRPRHYTDLYLSLSVLGVCHLTMASCSTSFLLCLLLLITHVLLMFYMNNK